MSSRLSPQEEQVEALKAECSDTGCKIQSLQAEIESIRALVRSPTSWSHDHQANNIPLPVNEMAQAAWAFYEIHVTNETVASSGSILDSRVLFS